MSHLAVDSASPASRLPPAGYRRYAVFGGVYNNAVSLAAVLDDAAAHGAVETYCLGDLGGFGPLPDRVFPILLDRGVQVMQGNYDHSIGHQLADCACGYSDPRDNHYARISYAYTQSKTADRWLPYLRQLPAAIRRDWGGYRVHMAHGSPRQVNEFLWETTSSDSFLRRLLSAHAADVLLVTHTGIPWVRRLPAERGGGLVVNVGAIGRPANDGRTGVWYALLDVPTAAVPAGSGPDLLPAPAASAIAVTLRLVEYDHQRLCHEMRAEALPEEFIETIATGYWTTCLEILPAKERLRGRF
jgi:diadenosine tetraphosphatase ApaH/serine/threonine PP2A family protein phosphatase